MGIRYLFKDSKSVDNVAKALLFVSKFGQDQALIKFGDQSVEITWTGTSFNKYHVKAQYSALDMFGHNRKVVHGNDHATVIKANPKNLGRTLKSGPAQDRRVMLWIMKEQNKIKIIVDYSSSSNRQITHTIPCEYKSFLEYKNMMEIDSNSIHYDTKLYIDNIHSFKHKIETLTKLGTPRIYVWSKHGGDLTITAISQIVTVVISMSDLYGDQIIEGDGIGGDSNHGHTEAGVNIETKKLSTFLSNLITNKDDQKICCEILHSQRMRVSYESEVRHSGERIHQSLVLIHRLNSN